MKLLFLGTGTSVGIPMIGCKCSICTSKDKRNKRRRASIWLWTDYVSIIVDVPPDFREQMLEFNVPRIDAIFVTHSHADHILGMDDVRRYNTIQEQAIPVFSCHEAVRVLRNIFNYAEEGIYHPDGVYRPRLIFKEIEEEMCFNNLQIRVFEVIHGDCQTLAYLFIENDRSILYAPDCKGFKYIKDIDTIKGKVDILIVDGLRYTPHPTHFNIEEAIRFIEIIEPQDAYLTHIAHEIDHENLSAELPDRIKLAFDGLEISINC